MNTTGHIRVNAKFSLTWGGIGRWVDFDVGVGIGGGVGGGKLVEDCAGEGEVVRLQGDKGHDLVNTGYPDQQP